MDMPYIDFYSQEFKPELVEKYFQTDHKLFLPCENCFPLYRDGKYAIKSEYTGNDGYPMPMFIDMPETLNEFITDCKRAGIELEWKNE
jgi:hypothetical protein